MKSISRRKILLAAAIGAGVPAAQAQAPSDYPNRPIELVHGFGAGGNADQVARLIGQKLQELLKQSPATLQLLPNPPTAQRFATQLPVVQSAPA